MKDPALLEIIYISVVVAVVVVVEVVVEVVVVVVVVVFMDNNSDSKRAIGYDENIFFNMRTRSRTQRPKCSLLQEFSTHARHEKQKPERQTGATTDRLQGLSAEGSESFAQAPVSSLVTSLGTFQRCGW